MLSSWEKEISDFHKSLEENGNLGADSHYLEDREIVKSIIADNMESCDNSEDFLKGFGADLQKRFKDGVWRTINGAKVFINGGKVVAGLGGFNDHIDKFFAEKKAKQGTSHLSHVGDTERKLAANQQLDKLSKKELIELKTKHQSYIQRNPKNHSVVSSLKDKNQLIDKLIDAHNRVESDKNIDNKSKQSDKSKIWGMKDEGKKESKENQPSLKHFIGDEGMFRGGEFKILGYQSYPNRYTIQELDKDGKLVGKPYTINQKDFETSFSKFQNNKESKEDKPKGDSKKEYEIQKLEKQKAKLEERYDRAAEKTRQSFANVGFGANMRGYKRTSSISFSKEDELKQQIKEINSKINELKNNGVNEFKKKADEAWEKQFGTKR